MQNRCLSGHPMPKSRSTRSGYPLEARTSAFPHLDSAYHTIPDFFAAPRRDRRAQYPPDAFRQEAKNSRNRVSIKPRPHAICGRLKSPPIFSSNNTGPRSVKATSHACSLRSGSAAAARRQRDVVAPHSGSFAPVKACPESG